MRITSWMKNLLGLLIVSILMPYAVISARSDVDSRVGEFGVRARGFNAELDIPAWALYRINVAGLADDRFNTIITARDQEVTLATFTSRYLHSAGVSVRIESSNGLEDLKDALIRLTGNGRSTREVLLDFADENRLLYVIERYSDESLWLSIFDVKLIPKRGTPVKDYGDWELNEEPEQSGE